MRMLLPALLLAVGCATTYIEPLPQVQPTHLRRDCNQYQWGHAPGDPGSAACRQDVSAETQAQSEAQADAQARAEAAAVERRRRMLGPLLEGARDVAHGAAQPTSRPSSTVNCRSTTIVPGQTNTTCYEQ